MKNAMMALGILMMGLITIGIVNVVNNYTNGAELDYYALKTVTEAAMLDSTDTDFYRVYGVYRMDREMFAESFLRRFANAIQMKNYTIDMYDINEAPPKVSVTVTTRTTNSFSTDGKDGSLGITNSVDAIIESSKTTNLMDKANSVRIRQMYEEAQKGTDKYGKRVICEYNIDKTLNENAELAKKAAK